MECGIGKLHTQIHRADVCVVGGGMAGLLAAVAAARHGARVVLMHDRPVLGGNASSEVRMWIRGAAGKLNRETGLLQEIELENIFRNPTMNYSLWDSVLLQMVLQEKNITLLLNCSCMDAGMSGNIIQKVTGWQLTTYLFHTVHAKLFIDCSGDSILAPLSGARYRVGRESSREYGEYAAPEAPDAKTMGNTCLIEARETDHPCVFVPPPWAHVYETDEALYMKNHDFIKTGVNFWWIELGGEENTIRDAEDIREELLRVAFGVWDHIKNHGDHGADNWELEWVGFLPGKRESRRYTGDYVLTQKDLEEGTEFWDTVAFGGWTMDNHAPEGLRYPGYSSHHIKPRVPYGIPFRALYSQNVENLLFAGRNISATHMAMSSTRVMATCSVIGQAVGTAAAMAVRAGLSPREAGRHLMPAIQEALLEDGCFLPGHIRRMPALMVQVELSLPSPLVQILLNGRERPEEAAENHISFQKGERLTLSFPPLDRAATLRLVLDPDFSRESISPHPKYQAFAMRTHIPLHEEPVRMPAAMARSLTVRAKTPRGEMELLSTQSNHQALIRVSVPEGAEQVTIVFLDTWGGGPARLFSCDLQ